MCWKQKVPSGLPPWWGCRDLLYEECKPLCFQRQSTGSPKKQNFCLCAHSAQLCREREALGGNTQSVIYSFTNPGNGRLLGFETFCTRPTLREKTKWPRLPLPDPDVEQEQEFPLWQLLSARNGLGLLFQRDKLSPNWGCSNAQYSARKTSLYLHFNIQSPYLDPHGLRSISPDVSMMPWEVFIYLGPLLYVWWVPVVGSVVLSTQIQQNGSAAQTVTTDKKGVRELWCRMLSPKLPLLPLLNLLLPQKAFRSGFPMESRDYIQVSNSWWQQRWHLSTLVPMKTFNSTVRWCRVLLDSTGVNKQ